MSDNCPSYARAAEIIYLESIKVSAPPLVGILLYHFGLGKTVRRGRAADGRVHTQLRKVPPPRERWVARAAW